jgi:hypothetical protein
MAEEQATKSEQVIGFADIYKSPTAVKVEKRQVDAAPQATFHYGDGTYVMLFAYKKDSKAATRGGNTQTANNPSDQNKPEAKKTSPPTQ